MVTDVGDLTGDDMEERRSDRFEITLKDVYDVANRTETNVGTMTGQLATMVNQGQDHEVRLRDLENGRWKTTASLWVAGAAVTGSLTLGILRLAGVDIQ